MARLLLAKALAVIAVIAGVTLAPAGCKDEGATPGARTPATPDAYKVRGKVTAVPATPDGEYMIHHELIPRFRAVDGRVRDMMSMEMPFALDPGVASTALTVGALVELDLEVRWDAKSPLRIKAVRPLPSGTTLELK